MEKPGHPRLWVECLTCGASGADVTEWDAAESAWNTRAVKSFGAVDVMRLRDWLGVKGGDISEDVWLGMDEKTRRLRSQLINLHKAPEGG